MSHTAHASQRPYPVHPNHLVGSKWSTDPDDDTFEFCHWEVQTFYKKTAEVLLFATLNKDVTVRIPWRALRDRSTWHPGWR